MKAVTEQAAS